MPVCNEAEAQELFTGRYERAVQPADVAAERKALGSDYGANGFTTLEQADHLAGVLQIAMVHTDVLC